MTKLTDSDTQTLVTLRSNGASYRQIAEAMGCHPQTVKSHLYHLRQTGAISTVYGHIPDTPWTDERLDVLLQAIETAATLVETRERVNALPGKKVSTQGVRKRMSKLRSEMRTEVPFNQRPRVTCIPPGMRAPASPSTRVERKPAVPVEVPRWMRPKTARPPFTMLGGLP